MISYYHKTLFVHIPKTAGQSIETMFLNDLGLNWDQRQALLLRKKLSGEKGPIRLAHLKAIEYVRYKYVSPEDFDDFFKFSFVRNPFSRVYSFYKFLGYSQVCDFKIFVSNILTAKVLKKDFFFAPQTEYLFNDRKELVVDFVGRFENISEDILFVKNASNVKSSLPRLNKSKVDRKRGLVRALESLDVLLNLSLNNKVHSDYHNAYDKSTIDIVRKVYKDDLDYFDYDF